MRPNNGNTYKLSGDKSDGLERLFLGTFQDQLKWLNFLWELKKILLAKIYGMVIRFVLMWEQLIHNDFTKKYTIGDTI